MVQNIVFWFCFFLNLKYIYFFLIAVTSQVATWFPGRLHSPVDAKTQKSVFQIHRCGIDEVTLGDLVKAKDDFSGADIRALCAEAVLMALGEPWMKVTNAGFKKSEENNFQKKQESTSRALSLMHQSCLQELPGSVLPPSPHP